MGCVASDQKNRKKDQPTPAKPGVEAKAINDNSLEQKKQPQHSVQLNHVAAEIDFKVSSHGRAQPTHLQSSKEQEVRKRSEIENSANSVTKQAALEKYNISVKDSSNKVLSINTYDYHGLLMTNPGTFQVK